MVLIYSDDWRDQVEELRPSFTTVEHVVALGEPGPGDARLRRTRRDAHRDSPTGPTSRHG